MISDRLKFLFSILCFQFFYCAESLKKTDAIKIRRLIQCIFSKFCGGQCLFTQPLLLEQAIIVQKFL